MPEPRLKYLFEKYLAKTCNDNEMQELAFMILAKKNENELNELLQESWDKQLPENEMPEENASEIIKKILTSRQPSPTGEGSVRRILPWKRVAAAAAILIMVSVGGYFIYRSNTERNLAKLEPQEIKNDVAAPTISKATITLADGSRVSLDSAASGTLAIQGNVNVQKTADGKIIYSALRQAQGDPSTGSGQAQYNTLTNPRGSMVIDMTLADGSHVWLNAGSSVTYPVAFAGNERKVSMTGEAYFEIAHLTLPPTAKGEKNSVPFLVEANGTTTEVLGTHFNVNAYSDEGDVKVTLLEGSVAVRRESSVVKIKPGEQAQVNLQQAQGDIRVVKGIDVDQVMAWRNGLFEFNNTELPAIMRQVARWYDIDVLYEGKPTNTKFGGGLSMKLPLSNVIKLLEANGLKFKVDGKKVTVIY